MRCWIYRSTRNGETYLFLPVPDDTSRVPDGLLQILGRLELVMQLTLSPERRLARADAGDVMRALGERGYYLQMPPVDIPGQGRIQ
jgi:uncharacterized protein YcgL (UPF0745 family)